MIQTRLLSLAAGAILVSACNGIGDGNTVETMELIPTSNGRLVKPFEAGDVYPLYKCLRDEVSLIGTFGDGQRVQFNSRARWSSSDESVVLVSNRDISIVGVGNGAFTEISTQPFAGGTLVPVGEVGEEATITAEFAGLSASIRVRIEKPQLRIVPVPQDFATHPFDVTPPVYLGVGTSQRLAVVANYKGRLSTSITSGSLNSSINPILWKFTNGEFEDDDEEAFADYEKWSVPDAATRQADISAGGVITGRAPTATNYQVEAQLSLCPDETDPDLKPVMDVRVLPFDQTTPVTVAYQPNLHAAGSFAPPAQFADGDMPDGTSQLVNVTGHLDLDGDGIGDVEQDLVTQTALEVSPRDSGCDPLGLNCISNTLVSGAFGTGLLSALNSTGGRLDDGYDPVCISDPENVECSAETDPDPDTVYVQACIRSCAPRLASLEAAVNGSVATLTASAYGLDGTPTYLFDCGDGSPVQDTGQVATADCDYGVATGPFTAQLRVLDGEHAVTQNAGAVQVYLGAVPEENNAPTAALRATPSGGGAPMAVVLSASDSCESDADDAITVYEFQPEPGVVVRQTSKQLTWVYLDQPAANPAVIAYDQYGVASEPATVEVTVETSYPGLIRSAPLPVRSIDARPCALEVVSPDTPVEPAFTFPGLAFTVVASFIAEPEAEGDEESDPCDTEPLIGTQDATRFVGWTVRPEGVEDEVSEYVTLRSSTTDFQDVGQTIWFETPDEEQALEVFATPSGTSTFRDVEAPASVPFTALPCEPETCTP